MVNDLYPKRQENTTSCDFEIPFTATEQSGKVQGYAKKMLSTLFPMASPKPILIAGKLVGAVEIDGTILISDPELFNEHIGVK